jgi:acetolactate synthase-1/2/3 large subunit
VLELMPEMKGGEIIVDRLIRERMPYVFGLCGHGILGFLDAVYDRRDEIKTISVHHESVAALMADAWYRVRQEPVATFTSCGPGSANLPVGVASAFMDSSAFLAITGNVPTSQWNRGPFQETGRYFQGEFVNVLRPYVKRSFQPTRVDMLPRALSQAFALLRSGRPGPVHIDVPLNVFVEKEEVSEADLITYDSSTAAGAGSPSAIREAVELLAASRRPVIVAGHGLELARGEKALQQFVEVSSVPVATTPLGKGTFDASHPLSLGATGRNGSYAANAACRNADVVLALGTRFDDRSTSAWLPGFTFSIPPTRLIHVDIDTGEIGRNFPATIGITGDARLVLEQLIGQWPSRTDGSADWLNRIERWKDRWEEELQGPRGSDAVPIQPARLVAELRRAVPLDGVVLADVGVHHNWLVCDYPAYRSHTLLQSWGFATMGFGVAGALGAKLAAPDRPVVAVCGDGGFLMHSSAVATAVEYDIPVVWVVWNNYGYISIRDQQLAYFGAGRELATSFRDPGGGLTSTDFAGLARSMGAEGQLVERPSHLADQLRAAIESGRPTVLDVRVDRDAPPPATASWDLPPLPHPMPSFGWGEDGFS